MLKRTLDRGDTLIEVLFALTIFSLIVVTSLTLMNQGTAAAQRSLEITSVRQQIDGQAEALRFMHDAYVGAYQSGITFNITDTATSPAEEWFKMMNAVRTSGATQASQFSGQTSCATPPSHSFIINTRAVTYVGDRTFLKPATEWSELVYGTDGRLTASNGMWIEGIRSATVANSNTGYVDFHIRACWYGPGSNTPMTIGTIVRLYEPRG